MMPKEKRLRLLKNETIKRVAVYPGTDMFPLNFDKKTTKESKTEKVIPVNPNRIKNLIGNSENEKIELTI